MNKFKKCFFSFIARKDGLSTFLFEQTLPNKITKISPWHDIPIYTGEYLNTVIEIPKGNLTKLELNKLKSQNPIEPDTKENKILKQTYVRSLKLAFPFNYGFIPQTWESVHYSHFGKYLGDDDPLDVIEISNKPVKVGDVLQVHILGSICLIDQNEADYKIITIDKDHLKSNEIDSFLKSKSFQDIFKKITNTLINYKVFEGKPKNFIYEDKFYSIEETKEIISLANIDYRTHILSSKN